MTDTDPDYIQLVLSKPQRQMIEQLLTSMTEVYIAGPIPFDKQDHECCECVADDFPTYFLGVTDAGMKRAIEMMADGS